jgi:4-amino-4-deoxy-L-arabinose transferase-like glycosyltransferase
VGMIITIIGIFLLALFIFFLNKNREVDEPRLTLKLIGYYTLGIFNLKINGLLIPLGFIISLFMKPATNTKVKRLSSVAGVIVMLIFHLF